MAAYGNYLYTPRSSNALLSVANANRDGTGTLATVMTGATRNTAAALPAQGGSRIDKLSLQALGTTTAGMIRLFVDDGTNKRMVAEIPVDPVTPSATERAWSSRLSKDNSDIFPIILADGAILKASTEKAESFAVVVLEGGDF